jgi:hypothetical protein
MLGAVLAINLFTAPASVYAQEPTAPPGGMAGMKIGGSSGTANDLFIMFGSGVDRPVPWYTTSSIGYTWSW